MKVMSVQKQTAAGQRTRFKAFVVVGDSDGHVGLGVKCAKEVANAVEGASIQAKLAVIPVRRGYWVCLFILYFYLDIFSLFIVLYGIIINFFVNQKKIGKQNRSSTHRCLQIDRQMRIC